MFTCLPRALRASLLAAFVLLCSSFGSSQQVVINELFNSSLSTDEWLEFLVVQDDLDMRGWSIEDFSSSGGAGGLVTFSTAGLWSALPAGTMIVVGQSGATFSEDTDASDRLVMVKASNGIYFSGTPFLLAGASDAVHIRDAAAAHVVGVSWGSANAASIGSPKVHFASASSSNTVTFFAGGSLAALTSTANWTQNSAASTRGAGNNPANIAWITSLSGNTSGDGSGRASVDPDTVTHGVTTDLAVTYRKDSVVTVTDLRLILPGSFTWSHATDAVLATNMTSTISVSGDTVTFAGLALSADSTVITIQSVTMPETTGLYPVVVQSKAQSAFASVAPAPQVLVFGVPQAIADVKAADANGIPLQFGQIVTIRGIVTVANQFGGPSYIQDNTGGMAIFGSAVSASVAVGDEVTVSGKVDPFNGLCELTSPTLHTIWSSGNPVDPVPATCAQVFGDGAGGLEQYEGRLVRLNAVTVTDTFYAPIANWTVSGAGTNYRLSDATGHLDIRVDNGVDFANTPAPQGAFDIVGVVSQFRSASPFIGGYQLMPRSAPDILATGPIIASSPVESNLAQTSFTVSWTTVNNGTTRLRYGTTAAYEIGILAPDDILSTTHSVDLTGLTPATIYHVGAFSDASGDTSGAADLVVSTTSPAASTGQINVYFNKSVNTSVAFGEAALGNQDFVTRVVARINAARRSVDASLYNLSGAGEGDVIASALVAAKSRGVKVRVICEYDNSTTNAFSTLASNGITVINDRYDLIWYGAGLMHNKFFVFDGRGGAPESTWIWTGSWNPTDPGTNGDRQNVIEIQDAALAGAYTAEFSEMWGSAGDAPNQAASRFGARKGDNVPHNFLVNGVPLSVSFSPSDKTTARIASTLRRATRSVSAALLTFTRKELADTVIARKNAGKKTRVLMDNSTDTNNQFAYLGSSGVDVHLAGGSGLLHHKYAVVDGDDPSATSYLVTGSHNWSNSAENSNDENTLFVQNTRVANLYLQEFAARYYEAGGTDSIRLAASAGFSLSVPAIDFDSVAVGASKTDSVTVSNPGAASLAVSLASSTVGAFAVNPSSATILAGGSSKFYVTFTPSAAAAVTGSILFAHNEAGSPDTVTVQGTGTVPAGMVSVPVTVKGGWNMISLPVDASNPYRLAVFPPALSMAFDYGGGYASRDTVLVGPGYWLKFPADATIGIVGYPVLEKTVAVMDKWNLIGSISQPVPSGSVGVSGTSIASSFFKYNAGYSVADTIQPGAAHWVKVNGEGGIILSASAAAKERPRENPLSSFSSVTLSESDEGGQTLYVGPDPGGEFRAQAFELPPASPAGAFDARFASGSMVETYPAPLERPARFPLTVRTRSASLKVSWHIDSQDRNSYTLVAENGRASAPLALAQGDGEGTIAASPTGRFVLSVSASALVPANAMLLQNYPNPFNPVTTIPYALAVPANVTLNVFNVLGEAVATLLDRQERAAGYHQVVFDASRLSSGIYYYQMQAAGKEQPSAVFQQVQKLVLIK